MTKVALYNPYLETRGGGEKVCLALAESLHKDLGCKVVLVGHKAVDLGELAHYFKLDLEGIDLLCVDMDTRWLKLIQRFPIPGRIMNIVRDRKVGRAIKRGGFDLFINNCYQSNLPSPTKLGVYMCMFPQRLDDYADDISSLKRIYIWTARKLNRLILHPRFKSPIDTYQVVTANSAYTQSHITRLWHRDSQILYPICENMQLAKALPKEKIILHVGRFFENTGESHHKRHDVLLTTFADMKKLHADGWELHFAGSVAEDVGALKYILQMMKDAQELPVYFHFNTSFAELQRLYNQASIYWHATGYGSSPEEHPEKQEHFGIATVEAMSTGCIPVVINSAGQKESVVSGKNGFLWDTLTELTDQTYRVAEMKSTDLEKLAAAARQSTKRFDTAAFRKNVAEIFSDFVA